ncbi:hypothetical protein BDW59DRAFT_58137 [Aspergillus cavernicola]|uniref:Uncharacterized protein n=1 Tax=Aspergillus cavernicola TaxID=176166 RepID=A0ABR4IHA7_9EURO
MANAEEEADSWFCRSASLVIRTGVVAGIEPHSLDTNVFNVRPPTPSLRIFHIPTRHRNTQLPMIMGHEIRPSDRIDSFLSRPDPFPGDGCVRCPRRMRRTAVCRGEGRTGRVYDSCAGCVYHRRSGGMSSTKLRRERDLDGFGARFCDADGGSVIVFGVVEEAHFVFFLSFQDEIKCVAYG